MEDFESPGISLSETSSSDTSIVRTQPANNPDAYFQKTPNILVLST